MEGARQPTPFGWYLLHRMAEHEPRLTQSDVARLADVGQATISRWIYENMKPDTERLGRLALALGVSKNELLQRAGHGTATLDLEELGEPVLHPILAEARMMLDPTSPLTPDERETLEQVLTGIISPYRRAMRRRRRVS